MHLIGLTGVKFPVLTGLDIIFMKDDWIDGSYTFNSTGGGLSSLFPQDWRYYSFNWYVALAAIHLS